MRLLKYIGLWLVFGFVVQFSIAFVAVATHMNPDLRVFLSIVGRVGVLWYVVHKYHTGLPSPPPSPRHIEAERLKGIKPYSEEYYKVKFGYANR